MYSFCAGGPHLTFRFLAATYVEVQHTAGCTTRPSPADESQAGGPAINHVLLRDQPSSAPLLRQVKKEGGKALGPGREVVRCAPSSLCAWRSIAVNGPWRPICGVGSEQTSLIIIVDTLLRPQSTPCSTGWSVCGLYRYWRGWEWDMAWKVMLFSVYILWTSYYCHCYHEELHASLRWTQGAYKHLKIKLFFIDIWLIGWWVLTTSQSRRSYYRVPGC